VCGDGRNVLPGGLHDSGGEQQQPLGRLGRLET
jgi:hypothetical protein